MRLFCRIAIYITTALAFLSCDEPISRNQDNTSSDESSAIMEEASNRLDSCDFKGSIELYKQCLDKYKADKDSANMSECYFQLSTNYHRIGNFKMAIKMALECLHLDSCMNNVENMSSTYNTLAALCLSSKDIKSARKFILKAIELEGQTEDQSNMSVRYGMAAEIYTKLDSTETGYDYALRAYQLDKANGNKGKMGKRLSQMGDALTAMGEYKKAEQSYLDAESYLDSANITTSICINYKQLGNLYNMMGNKSKSIIYHEKSLNIARRYDLNYLAEDNLSALSTLYSESNKSKAYDYSQEALILRDSIYTQEIQQATQQFSAQYDLLEKESHIAKQAHRLRMQKIMIWSILTALILVIAIGVFYVYIRFIRKEKRELHIKYSHALVTDFNKKEESAESVQEKDNIDNVTESDRQFLLKVNDVIEKNIEDSSLSSLKISEEVCLGQRQVNRKIKAITGIDTGTYIKMQRISKAKKMLLSANNNIGDVQSACGFDSPSYFSKVFKDVVGMTPTEYRKS